MDDMTGRQSNMKSPVVNENEAQNIWDKYQTVRKSIWYYLFLVFVMIAIGFIAGAFGSLSFSVGHTDSLVNFGSGVNYFWPGIIVQQVGSIWFGAWGILAGVIFPFLSNAAAQTPFVISLAYIPANFIQAFLPAYIFRHRKLDPRLKSAADYLYLLLSMFVGNLIGASWSVLMLIYGFGRLTWSNAGSYFLGWFGGNMIAGVVFNFVILNALSQHVILSQILVKKWWQ